MGVMINMLSGNASTVDAIKAATGRTISHVGMVGETLTFTFDDGSVLGLRDNGQSCCESRYMTCGDLDNAAYYKGATFDQVELRDAPDVDAGGEEHNVQFLLVTTSKGVITAETHVEHNGYYGGFSICASIQDTPTSPATAGEE